MAGYVFRGSTPRKKDTTRGGSAPFVLRMVSATRDGGSSWAGSDETLVCLLRAGRPGASRVLIERYGRYVERLVVRTLGSDPDVPDLVNEIFAEALESIHTLRDPAALTGWIGSVALTTARAFLRNRSRRRHWVCLSPPDSLAERATTPVPAEVYHALDRTQALLDRLPLDERSVLSLRLTDAKLAEIAEITGVSLSTVKRRLSRASRRFRSIARADPVLRDYIDAQPR